MAARRDALLLLQHLNTGPLLQITLHVNSGQKIETPKKFNSVNNYFFSPLAIDMAGPDYEF